MIAEQYLNLDLPKERPWDTTRAFLDANLAEGTALSATMMVFKDGSRVFRETANEPWQVCSVESWELVTNA